MIKDLQQFVDVLSKENELVEIENEVDPYLEAAEIHRRVIAARGPALLFKKIKGSPFPLVTNLFGNKKRIELAFGKTPQQLIAQIASLPEELMPPSISGLWSKRSLLGNLAKVGLKRVKSAPVSEVVDSNFDLNQLPLLTTWPEDGGPFITLPLVYTQPPDSGSHNLGMYRLQRHDSNTLGFHAQIGKGAGFHLAKFQKLNRAMPVNIHIGGPPALILAAISPLPENVPELMLASLIMQGKLKMVSSADSVLPFDGSAEFVLSGEVPCDQSKPEGPFGDHYGYYSLKHDYPVFNCKKVFRRKNPIFTATVVGKPRQEDFFLGDYLQELLSPLIKLVMPNVLDLWSYGETGYHSLTAAVVNQRYKREAMAAAFRILGEGQLSLTKFLLLVDKQIDLRNFCDVLEYVLERADFRSDLYVFSNLSMDTLDYTGPKVNHGSKGVLLGLGDPIRELPFDFNGSAPRAIKDLKVFCRGCLVLEGKSYAEQPELGKKIVSHKAFKDWPLLVLVDNADKATRSSMNFLWTVFTRFEPAADILGAAHSVERNHLLYHAPVLIDARMKPSYPKELFCDPKTAQKVSESWTGYFSSKVEMGDSDLADLS